MREHPLDLGRPTVADVPAVHAIYAGPRVWQHLPSGRHLDEATTRVMVERWDDRDVSETVESPRPRERRAERQRRRRARLDAWAGRSRWRQLLFVLVSVETRDRVFLLAGQAFFAIVPATLVAVAIAASTLTPGEGARFSDLLVRRYDLDEEVDATVEALFSRPGADSGSTSVGLLSGMLLVVSLTAFNRSLRRTFEHAWQRPTRGLRAALAGAAGLVLIVAMLATSTWLPGWLAAQGPDRLVGAVIATVVAQVVVYAGFWWVTLWTLLQRRVPFGPLRRGALFAGVVQTATGWVAGTAMPDLLQRNAERYGVIGVAFAIIGWLLIHAAAIVVIAILSAQLSGVVEGPVRVVPPAGTLAAPVGSHHRTDTQQHPTGGW